MDPIAQRLAVHAADPRGLRPVHPVEHRRQRQKAPALVRVLHHRGNPPKLTGREIPPNAHRCWHGANPPRAMESAQPEIQNPRESQTTAVGMTSKMSEPSFRFFQKAMFGSARCLARFSAVMRKGKAWNWKAGWRR